MLILLNPILALGSPIELGIKGGPAWYTIFPNSYVIFGNESGGFQFPGFNAGVFADCPLTDSLHFQPEALFVLKGNMWDGSQPYQYPYLEMPLLLKVKFLTIGQFTTHFLAGPYFATMIHGLYPNPGPVLSGANVGHFDAFDTGLDFGLSFELYGFVLDGRFDIGYNSIYDTTVPNPPGATPEESQANGGLNQGFMLSLGYKLISL